MRQIWVLRWFRGEKRFEYRGKGTRDWGIYVPTQRQAERFNSKAEALEAVLPQCCFGSGGPGDTVGWKAVRLVKKVAARPWRPAWLVRPPVHT